MSIITVELAILIIVAIVTWKWFKSREFRGKARLLPGPPGIPILGNGYTASKWPKGILDYLVTHQNKYGHVTRHWIGSNLYVSITDPDDIQIILKDSQNIKKSHNYKLFHQWLGKGLITSDGDHWFKHRRILTPAFHFSILERTSEVFNESANILIKILEEYVDKPSFDIYPYITYFSLDSILESAMGTKLDIQRKINNPYIDGIHKILTIIRRRSFNPLLRISWIFSLTNLAKEYKNTLKVVHQHTHNVIQERKTMFRDIKKTNNKDAGCDNDIGKQKRYAFLDLLLKFQETGEELSDEHIREEVETFMFAGHDTTASGLSFAMYQIANNQDVQQRLYREIEDVLGNNSDNPTLNDINNMKYLEQVVKEVIRLFPPVPLVGRLLENDLQLSNHLIPKGATLSIFIYMIHRNPEVYPDPEKFDPERFSIENTQSRHPFAYVPFSAGLRNCIGQKYAMLEMKSVIVKILRNYVLLPGDKNIKLETEVILKSSTGMHVRIIRRNKQV